MPAEVLGVLGRGSTQTGCCELGRGATRSRPEFQEGLPHAAPVPAPQRAAASARHGPTPRGCRSTRCSPAHGKGHMETGTSSPSSTSASSRTRLDPARPQAAKPCPAPDERARRKHLRGAGRGAAAGHCTYRRPPRPACCHQSALASHPLPTPFP